MPERDEADILYGVKAIATFVGITPDQAKHRVAKGQIPSFKIGGTVCALRSSIRTSLAARAAGQPLADAKN